MEYIPLEDCKPKIIYRIASRNLSVGIYDPDSKGFVGPRSKFGDAFLFTEIHWDADPNYGTAKPLNEIGTLPEDIEYGSDEMLIYLIKLGRKLPEFTDEELWEIC